MHEFSCTRDAVCMHIICEGLFHTETLVLLFFCYMTLLVIYHSIGPNLFIGFIS